MSFYSVFFWRIIKLHLGIYHNPLYHCWFETKEAAVYFSDELLNSDANIIEVLQRKEHFCKKK